MFEVGDRTIVSGYNDKFHETGFDGLEVEIVEVLSGGVDLLYVTNYGYVFAEDEMVLA